VSEEAKHSPDLGLRPDLGMGLEPLPASAALVPYAVRVNASLVRRGFWPKIRRIAARAPFAEDAVALWFCALDKETPASTKALLLAALAWFVVPKPFRPRRLPIPGLQIADEAAVIAAALALARRAVQPRHREQARAVLARMARS
jgi:uncharacterized membrane protein YkvA (DUF1232 family)